MHRTTLMLPADLKARASRRARELGISLAELIRRSLEAILDSEPASARNDPLFSDDALFAGKTPADLSAEHDTYLYGEDG